jgi:hypothetical protein
MEHTQSYNVGNVQGGAEIWAAAKPEWSNKDVSTRRPDMREGMQMVGAGKNSTALKSCVGQLIYLIRDPITQRPAVGRRSGSTTFQAPSFDVALPRSLSEQT